jgi:predicted nucleic acid-binding protein
VADPTFVLDTSALLTLIEDEPGATRVEEILRAGGVTLIWVSLLEVAYITEQERGAAEAERRYAHLKALPVRLVWEVDEATVLTAARFKAKHRLSLADAIIAAYAKQAGATLVHKDREFEALADLVLFEALPYKK